MSEMKPTDQISKAIPPETCHDTYSQLPAALRWVTATKWQYKKALKVNLPVAETL